MEIRLLEQLISKGGLLVRRVGDDGGYIIQYPPEHAPCRV